MVEPSDGEKKPKRSYMDRRPQPRTDNTSRIVGLAIVTVAVLGLMVGGFWSLLSGTGFVDRDEIVPAAEEQDQSAAEPAPAPAEPPADEAPAEPGEVVIEDIPAPAAPASNELANNDWLLSPYAIIKDDNQLVVTGTLKNRSPEARSAIMRVFVYVNGSHVATGVGEVRDVGPNASVEVSLPSGAEWAPGNKVLLVWPEDITG